MRDRRSTFTKEYINQIVNPLGSRPARPTELRNSAVAASLIADAEHRDAVVEEIALRFTTAGTTNANISGAAADQQHHTISSSSSSSLVSPVKGMLMPAGNEPADGLASLAGLGVLGAAAPASNAAAAVSATSGTATVQNKDTTWTKLFVGGLPYHTTDQSLREHFAVYGEIEEAVVITDRQTGKSRGYGFVIMGDKSSSDRACKDANPIIDGRKANVNLAILGAKPRGNVQTGYSFPGVRTGYPTLLPTQYGMPPSYVYQSPYLTATAPGSLVPLQATQLTHAAAVAAATSQFYEYQNAAAVAAAAAAPYTGQYTNGFEAYSPYTGAASAAGYLPYTYTLPQAPAGLQAATAGAFPTIPYPTAAQAQTLQEARLQ